MTLTEAQAMTPEEKRVKLAKLIGLEVVELPFVPNKVNRDAYFTTEAAQALYRQYPRGKTVKGIPDYCNDLNAVHEVEKRLRPLQLRDMETHLIRIVSREATDEDWADPRGGNAATKEWHATAAQRTTALILTLSRA